MACRFGQLGKYLITSPNADYIPEPAWGERNVRIRADFRYGLDDYTLWTQPYLERYPHMAAIPRKPSSSTHRLNIMWYNAAESDFVRDRGSAIRLGKLSVAITAQFRVLKEELHSRVRQYLEHIPSDNHPKFINPLTTAMQHSLIRLEYMDTTIQEMRFGITEFQRYYLELYGLMEWLEIYRPRMLGIQPRATTVADCMGAYVSTPRVAQEFFDAGIPVWVMRTAENFASSVPKILSAVNTRPPSQVMMEDATPAFPTIFTGHAIEERKYVEMHNFVRTFLTFRDPFQHEATPVNNRDPMLQLERPRASNSVMMRDLLQDRGIRRASRASLCSTSADGL